MQQKQHMADKLILSIGDLSFSLSSSMTEKVDAWRLKYHSFISNNQECRFSIKVIHSEEFFSSAASSNKVIAEDSESRTILRGIGFFCIIGKKTDKVLLKCVDDSALFDRALRIIISEKLNTENGLLIHGAAIKDGSRGYLFFGKSDAGKTTISNLSHSAGKEVLTDELSIVKQTKKGFTLYSTPFGGTFHRNPESASCPLNTIVNPVQADTFAVRKENPEDLLIPFLQTAMLFNYSPEANRRAFFTAQECIAQSSACSIEFRKNDPIWSKLDEN